MSNRSGALENTDLAEQDRVEQPIPTSAERVDYMADMISELRSIASKAGLTTLAGLLALAYVEANQQRASLGNTLAE